MYASEVNSTNSSRPAVSSRISRESFFDLLVNSVSEEFRRQRFRRCGGDLVPGRFLCRGRPLWGGVPVRISPGGDSARVIGGAEELNSAGKPEIDRMSGPEGE